MAVKRDLSPTALIQRSFEINGKNFAFDWNFKGTYVDYLCGECWGRKSQKWHANDCKVEKRHPLDKEWVIRIIGPNVNSYKGLQKIHFEAIRLLNLRYRLQ